MSDDTQLYPSHGDSPIFGDIPEEKRREIEALAEDITAPPRTLLVKQDEPGDKFFIIHSGRVRVYKILEDGSEMDLSVMKSGESFGEMALLTGENRSANVETLEETHLTVLAKEQFDRVLHDHPDISLQIVKQLSTWLKKDEQKLAEEAEQKGPSLSWLDFVFIGFVSLFCGIVFNQVNPNGIRLFPEMLENGSAFMITPEAVHEKYKSETILILDARPETFFNEEHIEGALNFPDALFDIMYLIHMEKLDVADRIVVYGRTISRRYDEKLTRRLDVYGYKNVNLLSGGLVAWKKQGYSTAP